MLSKRGQVGLDTAKAILLAVLVIGVLGFAMIIALGAMGNSDASVTSGSGVVSNETGGFINSSGYTLAQAGLSDFSGTITEARNATGAVISSANYTLSGAGVLTNLTTANYDSIFLDYTYTYNRFSEIGGNITNGTVSFFSNSGTWFALLAIVVIILIVAIVIFAVNRFGGRTSL